MSYLEKLQRIKARMEQGSQHAAQSAPNDESAQYRVLIEALEGIAGLLTNDHSWLDLPAKEYSPRSSSAPPADRAVERMAWAVHVVGLQMNALQDIFTQNQMIRDVLDSIPVTPVNIKAPTKANHPKEPESQTKLLDALPVGTSIARQQRARKFSGSGPKDAHLFSPTGGSSQSQLRTPPVDDAGKSSTRSSPSSVLRAAVGLNRKVSDLDLSTASGDAHAKEPKQFHLNPLNDGSRSRSGSISNLSSYLGKGRVNTQFDPTNQV
jgi:hypothetical protein